MNNASKNIINKINSPKEFISKKLKLKNKNENVNEEQNNKNENLFRKVKNWWPLSKISGKIFLIYTTIVLIGGFLLIIPGILTNYDIVDAMSSLGLSGSFESQSIDNQNKILDMVKDMNQFHWDYLTGIFTASSAFSDTGISIANVSHDYTIWGQIIIIIMIEVGGIGVLTFKIVLFLAINKKISLTDTVVAQSERGGNTTSQTIELIRDGFIWLTIIQIFSAALLFFAFFFEEPGTTTNNMLDTGEFGSLDTVSPYHNFLKSLWYSIFHSTSAINNAGFDLISGSSLQPYNVDGHRSYFIQLIFLFEWVVGGLGYPTFHDIKRKIKARRMGQTVKFSLFTKLNFTIYSILFIVGPLSILGTELANIDSSLIFNNYKYVIDPNTNQQIVTELIGRKDFGTAFFDIFFNSTAARNAGFSTVNINDFNAGSKTVMSILMFIGSAPSSTAGGIRTTTFAIILLANWAIVRNRNHTSIFKKTIPSNTVKRSFAVFFISTILVALSVIIIYADSAAVLAPGYVENGNNNNINGNNSIVEILTLITSAFGTVGMNPFTQHQMIEFGVLTKLTVILCMFLGQLGISNTLLAFIKPSRKQPYQYLEEDVTIG